MSTYDGSETLGQPLIWALTLTLIATSLLHGQAAPTEETEVRDLSETPIRNRISLEAHAAPGTGQIHWFADRRYLGASAPAEPMPWHPTIGDYELQAMDDSGRVTTRQIRVRLALAE